jgi:hypothetical protein
MYWTFFIFFFELLSLAYIHFLLGEREREREREREGGVERIFTLLMDS